MYVVLCMYDVKVAVLLGPSSGILTDNLIQLILDNSTEVCRPLFTMKQLFCPLQGTVITLICVLHCHHCDV